MKYVIFDDMSCCTEGELRRLLPLVSEQRRQTALRYKHTFGQWASLQSWLMLARLGVSGDWQYNEHGKPFVPDGPQFSLSHCKKGIAVAVDDRPVGIDIETIRPVESALIARTMNEREQPEIAAAEKPEVAFTKLWTQKEAFLKYQGTGIIDDLQQVLENTGNVQFETHIRDEYIYTICYEKY